MDDSSRTDDQASFSRTDRPPIIQVARSPELLLRVLLSVTIILVMAHIALAVNNYALGYEFFASEALFVLFDLWGEVTIPSWYSASLFLGCALILAVIATLKR